MFKRLVAEINGALATGLLQDSERAGPLKLPVCVDEATQRQDNAPQDPHYIVWKCSSQQRLGQATH
jgi:hypothetical protein